MSDEIKNTNKANSIFAENMAELMSPEGVQKYLLGTKKNGTPRAVYDVVRECVLKDKKSKKKGKKHKKKDLPTSYSFYLDTKDSKKKKKKKKKKNKDKDKYWHI